MCMRYNTEAFCHMSASGHVTAIIAICSISMCFRLLDIEFGCGFSDAVAHSYTAMIAPINVVVRPASEKDNGCSDAAAKRDADRTSDCTST